MRKRDWLLVFVLALPVVLAGLTYSWSFTPHGRLDYRAAFFLNLLTFEATFQPDPASDFELTIPINLAFPLSALLPREDVQRTEDVAIPGAEGEVPARVYWPDSSDAAAASPPVIVYLHGGGFVVGSVDIFDGLARSLANAASSLVVSVDYRLAPAHPYPAALDDSWAALVWVADNAARLGADPDRIVVAGDSAGGNLAAALALKARDTEGPPIAAQLLFYPATDLSDTEYPSTDHFAEGYGLSRAAGDTFLTAYAGHLEGEPEAYLSPLHAPSHAELPPALLVTAGFDPLTDSARAYAERLRESGVSVTHAHFPETIHGFMSVDLFSQRRAAFERTRAFLQERFGAEPDAAVATSS